MSDLIDRQAAIDALEREKTYCRAFREGYTPTNVFEKYNEGLTDGIKALRSLPSVKPTQKNESNTLDALDCVSRQAAIDAVIKHLQLDYEYAWGVREAINGLPSAQPEPKWIPCSERLPEEKKLVLCYCRSNIIDVLELCNDVWYHDYCTEYMKGFVLAWMPLPKPWKGEEK